MRCVSSELVGGSASQWPRICYGGVCATLSAVECVFAVMLGMVIYISRSGYIERWVSHHDEAPDRVQCTDVGSVIPRSRTIVDRQPPLASEKWCEGDDERMVVRRTKIGLGEEVRQPATSRGLRHHRSDGS